MTRDKYNHDCIKAAIIGVLALVASVGLLLLPNLGWAETLISDPVQPYNATNCRVELTNGTVVECDVVNNAVSWDISGLPVGTYEGQISYAVPEWVLTAEGETNSTGEVWSPATPFVLERRGAPSFDEKLGLKE